MDKVYSKNFKRCSNFLNIMVSGDTVVKEPLNVARKKALTWKSFTVCECSDNFLHIMVSFDPFIKEALTVGDVNLTGLD